MFWGHTQPAMFQCNFCLCAQGAHAMQGIRSRLPHAKHVLDGALSPAS